MRRFAFGVLHLTQDQFGRMPVGDMLDAMAGHNEARDERIKDLSGIIRIATSILWNIQVPVEDRVSPEELWPFEWEKKEGAETKKVPDEIKKETDEAQEKILAGM
jgi:hypothetical protein